MSAHKDNVLQYVMVLVDVLVLQPATWQYVFVRISHVTQIHYRLAVIMIQGTLQIRECQCLLPTLIMCAPCQVPAIVECGALKLQQELAVEMI